VLRQDYVYEGNLPSQVMSVEAVPYSPAPVRDNIGWLRWIGPLLLVVQWLLMCVLAQPTGNFPHNDDWAYVPAVQRLVETGEVHMPAWAAMNFIGHLLWGALFGLPFGVSFFTMRLAGLMAGLLGVLATYGLCREFGVRRPIAWLAAAVLAANPIYFAITNSFMTDAPFFAAATGSLWWYARALRTGSLAHEAGATLLAVVAILVRQTGLALPIAYAGALMMTRGLRGQLVLRAVAVCGAGVVAHLGWKAWMVSHGQLPPMYGAQVEQLRSTLTLPLENLILQVGRNTGMVWLYVAISCALLIGVVLAQGSRKSVLLRLLIAGAGGLLIYGVLRENRLSMPLLMNQLDWHGLGPALERNTPIAPSLRRGWALVTMLAAASGVGLVFAAGFLVRRWRAMPALGPERSMVVMVLVYAAVYVAPVTALSTVFDRYIIALLPVALVLLGTLASDSGAAVVPQRFARALNVVPAAGVLAMSLFAAALVHDYFAFHKVRWQQLDRLVTSDGVPAGLIDGGFEFNGLENFTAEHLRMMEKGWWVFDDQYLIRPDDREAGFTTYRHQRADTWLPFTSADVYVMQRSTYPIATGE
jgi:4-amino-4-deoxy-L-arabinose transferase-like glycosyltransferase